MFQPAASFVILGEFLQPVAEADRGNFPLVMLADGRRAGSPVTVFQREQL